MSVLDRSELQDSPLADLHAIADQLGLEGFRRLRKADLIDAILGGPATGGSSGGSIDSDTAENEEQKTGRCSRRSQVAPAPERSWTSFSTRLDQRRRCAGRRG